MVGICLTLENGYYGGRELFIGIGCSLRFNIGPVAQFKFSVNPALLEASIEG